MQGKEKHDGEEGVKAEHPGPWTWQGNELDGWLVLDSTGDAVMRAIDTPPLARELIRLAPEMEAALRSLEWSGCYATDMGNACCPDCRADAEQPNAQHKDDCALAAILAALDAARKAGA